MSEVTFKGIPIETVGELPKSGIIAPEFTLVRQDLTEVRLSQMPHKKKILNIVPSLDTSVCALTFKNFTKKLKNHPEIVFYTISKDLPFAQGRFCNQEKLPSTQTLSAFRSTFPREYGLEITNGPLEGLCSRVIIVLDENNKILYTQQVNEITEEPDYSAALKAAGI